MKKVLPILVLSVLFAALLAPTTASVVSAAPCGAGCQLITSSNPCDCGSTALPRSIAVEACDNGVIRSSCTGAGTSATATGEAPNVFPRGAPDLITKIKAVGDWVFVALMSVAGMFLIIAGFMWVTAGGNPEKANKARQMLINALIGVAIGLLARGIVQVIDSILR